MSNVLLFGLRLAPLFSAIAQVESERGATSENVYQLRVIYVEDVNRIAHAHYTASDRFDKAKSEAMMLAYWAYYGAKYREETGCAVTYQVLAKMHNRGGRYWKQGAATQTAAANYWRKVRRELDKAKGGAK